MQEERRAVEPEQRGLKVRNTNLLMTVIAAVVFVVLLVATLRAGNSFERMQSATDRYINCQQDAADMQAGSDYLTMQVRCFVITGKIEYLENFFEEIEVTQRRDKAVEDLSDLAEGSAYTYLQTALQYSNELVEVENLAMRLRLDTGNYDPSRIPESLLSIELSENDKQLSDQEKSEKALDLVFNESYLDYKDKITENVNRCTEELINTTRESQETASRQLKSLLRLQLMLLIMLIVLSFLTVWMTSYLVILPLGRAVTSIRSQEKIKEEGSYEMRFLASTYNQMFEETKRNHQRLSYEASHDALTGLYNRSAYQMLFQTIDKDHIAYMMIDVDKFKEVNDTYGHDIGDRVLRRVAGVLQDSFRSVDYVFRTGGDEFVVIMTRASSAVKEMVRTKIGAINKKLQNPTDDLPPISLSVGVAFSDRQNPTDDIAKDADTALYKVKEKGRNGCDFY